MNLDAERERLKDHLVRSAEEIRSAEHAGWGNVIDWAITMIDAQASALAEMQAETIERCAKAIKDKVAEHAKAFPESRHEHARLTFALDGATFTAAIRALGKGT